MKKVFEKIVEGILACSGFVTSLTIVLIVLFLFSEAVGLFNSRVIEEGYVLALNKDNKVSELTPVQIIIRKSKFPWFPERSVQFSGKRTKRSVQKKKAAHNTYKAGAKG